MTSTALDDHVLVLFEYDVAALVKVEHGDGGERGGGAAGLGHLARVHEVHQGLDDGVVGGVHVGAKGEGALPVAVLGLVALGGDDPVLDGDEECIRFDCIQ